MVQTKMNRVLCTALGAGFMLAAAGCSQRRPVETPRLDAVSKTVGFRLPDDAKVLAYRHKHEGKDMSECSQLWILQTAARLPGPDRRVRQSRVESPFASLRLLVQQATEGRVNIEAAERPVCQCVEWSQGEAVCRLRQTHARTGWIAALEVVSPH